MQSRMYVPEPGRRGLLLHSNECSPTFQSEYPEDKCMRTTLPSPSLSQHRRGIPIEVRLGNRLDLSTSQPKPENSIHLVVP